MKCIKACSLTAENCPLKKILHILTYFEFCFYNSIWSPKWLIITTHPLSFSYFPAELFRICFSFSCKTNVTPFLAITKKWFECDILCDKYGACQFGKKNNKCQRNREITASRQVTRGQDSLMPEQLHWSIFQPPFLHIFKIIKKKK